MSESKKTGTHVTREVESYSQDLSSHFQILGPLKPMSVKIDLKPPEGNAPEKFRVVEMWNDEFVVCEDREDGQIPEFYLSKSLSDNPSFFKFTQVQGGEYEGLKTLRVQDCVGVAGRINIEKNQKKWSILGLQHFVPGDFQVIKQSRTSFFFSELMESLGLVYYEFKKLLLSSEFQNVKNEVNEVNAKCKRKVDSLKSEFGKVNVIIGDIEKIEMDFSKLMKYLRRSFLLKTNESDIVSGVPKGLYHDVVQGYFTRLLCPFLRENVLSGEIISYTGEYLEKFVKKNEEEEKKIFAVEYSEGLTLLENHFTEVFIVEGKRNAEEKRSRLWEEIRDTLAYRGQEVTRLLEEYENGRMIECWRGLERYNILSFSLKMRTVQRCFEKFLETEKNPIHQRNHFFGSSSIKFAFNPISASGSQSEETTGEIGQVQKEKGSSTLKTPKEKKKTDDEELEGEDEKTLFEEIMGKFNEDLELVFVQASKDELYCREKGVEELSKSLLDSCCKNRVSLGVDNDTFFRTPWKMEEQFAEVLLGKDSLFRSLLEKLNMKLPELPKAKEGGSGRPLLSENLPYFGVTGNLLNKGSIFVTGKRCMLCFQSILEEPRVTKESINLGRTRSEVEVTEKFVQYETQCGYEKVVDAVKLGFDELVKEIKSLKDTKADGKVMKLGFEELVKEIKSLKETKADGMVMKLEFDELMKEIKSLKDTKADGEVVKLGFEELMKEIKSLKETKEDEK